VGTPVDAIVAIPDIVGDGTMEMVVGGRNGWIYCYSGGNNAVSIEYEIIENISGLISSLSNYPNPFNPETTIHFNLMKDDRVTLDVFNLRGQKVVTLLDEFLSSGEHDVIWDGKNNDGDFVASGIYLYKINVSGRHSSTKKMMLLK